MNIQGVTVIGEKNVVYTQYTELFRCIDILDSEIQKSDKIKDEDKLGTHADIETIKSQLGKPKPNRDILKTAWKGIEAAATIAGLVGLCQTVGALIAPLL
jgi:hypothetical protein